MITRHDYEQLPEGSPRYQLIAGDLVISPSPGRSHQQIVGNIHSILDRYLEVNQTGEAFLAPFDVFLSDINVYQPDVLFIRNENLSIVTEHGIEGGPDLVIEILFPGTARFDRGSKRKVYARTGVKELWLVDPETNRIEVFHLTEDAETPVGTYGTDSVFQSSLLPGLEISAARVFRR
ncbi:MAG: Uma2 family endonuclease [Verrucomicrobia bacterium]|nr:Uma2 family endonuclease [Verrucomicrobiota bacterium]